MKRHYLLVPSALLLAACQTNPPTPTTAVHCSEPRPMICTMDYQPVCGQTDDGERKTYSNGCSACSDAAVLGFDLGACPG